MISTVLDIDGTAAPPRRNGELAFDEPWQSRAFGLTMALVDEGRIEWEEFRQRLIAKIAQWEVAATPSDEYSYWERWLQALHELLGELDICESAQLDERASAFAARPHGHDH